MAALGRAKPEGRFPSRALAERILDRGGAGCAEFRRAAKAAAGSLRALRYAQQLARDFDVILVPVLAWLPPCGDLADRRTPNEELRRIWAQDASQRLQDVLNLAWGDQSVITLLKDRGG